MKKALLAIILIVLCFFSGYTLSKGHREKKAEAAASAASFVPAQVQIVEGSLPGAAL